MDLKALGLDPPAQSPLLKNSINYFIYQMSLVNVFQELYKSQLYFHKRFERSTAFEMEIFRVEELGESVTDYLRYQRVESAVERWSDLKKQSLELLDSLSSILTVDGLIITVQDVKVSESRKKRNVIYNNIKRLSVANLCYLLIAGSNLESMSLEYNVSTSSLRINY